MIDEVKALRVEIASLTAERDQLRRSVGDLCRKYDRDLAAANVRVDSAEARIVEVEELYATSEVARMVKLNAETAEALAAARRECEELRADIAALLPMAERAHHRDLGKHLGSDISDLPEGLRIAGEGALLLRLHHPDIAALAAPAAGEEGKR